MEILDVQEIMEIIMEIFRKSMIRAEAEETAEKMEQEIYDCQRRLKEKFVQAGKNSSFS